MTSKRLITVFLPYTFVILGIFLLSITYYYIKKSNDSKQWKETDAVITNRLSDYRIISEYQYEVKGCIYFSSRIIFSPFDRNRSEDVSAIQRLPSSSKIAIFYDPHNPKESVIFTSKFEGYITTTILGSLFLLAGIMSKLGARKYLK